MDHARPDQIVQAAADLIQAGMPLEAVHHQIVSTVSTAAPAPCWQAIAGIDTNRDVQLLAGWITAQLSAPATPPGLSGLWFGLHETRPEPGGPAHVMLELAGGAGFPDDEQWLRHLTWRPGTAPAPGLAQLLPLGAAAPPEVYDLIGYAVVLSYAMALTIDAVEAAAASSLASRPVLAIATGFHDGDIALLGTAHHGQTTRTAITWI